MSLVYLGLGCVIYGHVRYVSYVGVFSEFLFPWIDVVSL